MGLNPDTSVAEAIFFSALDMNLLQTLQDLVAIPSVNPMRPNTGEPAERDVAAYIELVLRRHGIDCEMQTVAAGRQNVIGVVQASKEQSRSGGLLLNSHMDTVPTANMAIAPFDPVMENGRIFGRGSCDAKASLAAMLTALCSHAQRKERCRPVVFAATVDEEFSFAGSRKLIERDWPVSAAVVGEPTLLRNIVAHKGVVRWHLRVLGVSAHGATPCLGRSAIYDGARLALLLEQYAGELRRRTGHALLGAPTLNVGRVSGGQAVNMVPDICDFEIDRRLLPSEQASEALSDCESWLRDRLEGQLDFQLEDPYLIDPALETSTDAPIVSRLQQAQESALGQSSPCLGAHYGTDGSKLALAGIETVVCGPGDIVQAHTNAEFVEVKQLELAARLYDRLIQDWQ